MEEAMRSLSITTALAGALMLAAPAMAQEEPVRIGVLTDESGPYADSAGPGSILAAQMAVDDFGGKFKGRKIEIVHADTQNKPDVASNIARRWFDNEGVSAIVDLPVTPVAYAVMELARAKSKSVLVTASATSDITAKFCSPTLTHWADDTHALAAGTAKALIDQPGGKQWYFIAVDIAFGAALQRDATEVIEKAGGKVVGSTRHPVNAGDFSSLILQAQNSKAPMIGLASVGADLVNIVKQAREFNVGPEHGQNLVGLLIYINDIHALGAKVAQGLIVTSGFYWDQSEASRAFAKRFFDQRGAMPSKNQAEIYTAVSHYLRAMAKAGTDEPVAVNKAMRDMPLDYFGKPAHVRADGRVVYNLMVYRVRKPGEAREPWDYYEPIRAIPAEEAFLPINMEKCGG
jgi:branched-chain amino acid transport system substrate-binding protein